MSYLSEILWKDVFFMDKINGHDEIIFSILLRLSDGKSFLGMWPVQLQLFCNETDLESAFKHTINRVCFAFGLL